LVRWSIFDQKQLFLFNPDHIKEVFKADGAQPVRSVLEPLVKLHKKVNIKSALINSQNERWRQLRSASNPIIARPQTIKSYLPMHNTIASELINVIKSKIVEKNFTIIDKFQIYLKMLCLEYISEIAFDKRLKCLNENERSHRVTRLHESIDEFSVYCGRLFFQTPLWKIFATKDWQLFENSGTFIYSEVKRYILEAYEYHCLTKNIGLLKQTVLSQYLDKIDKYNLTIDDVISIMAELLIGSIDTTAATLHYLLYELSVNERVQENLYQEIKSIMNNSTDDMNITEEHLEKFKYLKWVVKENMRINTIAPTNSRILSKNLEIENYLVPKGVS